MKMRALLLATATAVLVGSGVPAAQSWGRPPVPRNGACFYEDINYGGRYFCYNRGASQSRVPSGANDEISSIRVFGDAQVIVYKDSSYHGSSRRFVSNMSDLRRAGWNDRISSFRIESRSHGDSWGGAYGGGSWNGGGYGDYHGNGHGGAYGGGGWNSHNSNGGRWTYQQAEQIVRRAYRSTLGRDPDPAARPWVNEVMKNNWSQSQLEAELRKSPEYRAKHGR
jgi:Peptidase inhibitor family I36